MNAFDKFEKQLGVRKMPQNIYAEQAVLGAMFLNPSAIGVALDIIGQNSDLFYLPQHGDIYTCMLEMFSEKVPIDEVTLPEWMTKRGVLDRCGGMVYLAELTGSVPTSSSADYYSSIVLEKGLKRRAIQSLTDSIGRLYDDDTKALDVAEEVCRDACALIEGKSSSSMHTMFDGINASMKEIQRRRELGDVPIGVPTGIPMLDSLLLGLRPGTLNIIAARPSVGKSAIAANITHNVALQGSPVLLFSLEMDFVAISNRILTISTRTPYRALCDASITEKTNKKLTISASLLGESSVVIDDAEELTMMKLRSKARRFRTKHAQKTPVIIVDYLQNCKFIDSRNKTRNEQIGEFTRDCKQLSRELKCPIVLLCQLSREAEGKDNPFECLSNLKESGNIEQDADTVLIVTKNCPKDMHQTILDLGLDINNVINAAVAKNRDGPVGMCSFVFDRQTQHMEALADYVPVWNRSKEEDTF